MKINALRGRWNSPTKRSVRFKLYIQSMLINLSKRDDSQDDTFLRDCQENQETRGNFRGISI